jgi:SnoaL-like domain
MQPIRPGLAAVVCVLLASAVQAADPALVQRIAQLDADVTAAEDLSRIKRLQRTYGYYLDKGMWTDLAEYFTDDAVANYPAGVFIGKASIREHLYRNVGNGPMGQVGLGDNRLYNHMQIQPVVYLNADGKTARGRWRAWATLGSVGGGATWAEGLYEMQYRKENGVWKIANLDYHSGFGAPYATGWVAPAPAGSDAAATPASRSPRQLAHPADRERNMECEGFPAACVAPFSYVNPGSAEGARAWQVKATEFGGTLDTVRLRTLAAQLADRAARLHDETDIENLQRIYGYYLDRAQWDQVADLFTDNGTIEFAQQGVFVGRKRVRQFLGSMGPLGLTPGWMNDHLQMQIVVSVSVDGRSAFARSRELAMTGHEGKSGEWSEGVYENRFVREGGKWKIAAMHFFPTFQTDYDQGWGKNARPAEGITTDRTPDRPPSQRYEIYPRAHVPPYHYRNPVTGQPPTYPAVGGPDAILAAAALQPVTSVMKLHPANDFAKVIASAEQNVGRFRDYHEIENLESAYGYYLDKNLWDPLADLYARDGTMELAQRGVYKGADSVRKSLWSTFGRGQSGPVAGRLGNHLQLQPVITVADDGLSAKVRLRMFQQMSQGTRASIGASIYENQIVKQDGIWKFSVVHTMNTLSAGYAGGWAKAAGRFMPGPSAELPPDAPPTMLVAMYPIVYDIPYHYANPVSGRTALAKIPSIAEQLVLLPMPAPIRSAPGQ